MLTHPQRPTIPTKPNHTPHIMTISQFDDVLHISRKIVKTPFHGSTIHSPITHTDPPYPQNPPTTHLLWPFLHFLMFHTIQTIYFMKADGTYYPMTLCPLTNQQHRSHPQPTSYDHFFTRYKPNMLMSSTFQYPNDHSPTSS